MIVAPLADLAAWRSFRSERTAAVSGSIQTALRAWVGEWFVHMPAGLLRRRLAAQSLLVYQATAPFQGRAGGVFTYDVQQPRLVELALTSAASRLPAILSRLNTREYAWQVRERYYPCRAPEILALIASELGRLVRMFYVETSILNALLKFARALRQNGMLLKGGPAAGAQRAELLVRRAVTGYLSRFPDEFDPSPRAEELLAIATAASLPLHVRKAG